MGVLCLSKSSERFTPPYILPLKSLIMFRLLLIKVVFISNLKKLYYEKGNHFLRFDLPDCFRY